MFTGIITDVGIIKTADHKGGDTRFVIKTAFDMTTVDMGASIACSGCCLTVTEKGDNWFAVDVSAESLSKTKLADWEEGSLVNLERSLKMGDELGGHIVSGHVDGVAKLFHMEQDGESWRMIIEVPQGLEQYIAPKGSIALDGISLTVNEVQDKGNATHFGVNIIPHTWENTALKTMKTGDRLNLEVDMLARYVARILESRA